MSKTQTHCVNGHEFTEANTHRYMREGTARRRCKACHALWARWWKMKRRCSDPSVHNYHRYGGRGITVCERWASSFENFLADMGEPPPGMTLDRINNDGNYEPGNCRWATMRENIHNSSSTREVEFRGESMPMSEWAEKVGIKYRTLQRRINRLKWPVERAMMTPVRNPR